MKTKQFIIAALVLLTGAPLWAAGAATNEVSTLLQKGLFEEEANHNLEAAIQAYQAVVVQTEKDRQFAATAIFRMGECYRKLGRTNEANIQYQRILREFADQTELAKLSQVYVGNLQNTGDAKQSDNNELAQQAAAEKYELSEIARIKALIKDSPDLINGRRGESQPPLIKAVRDHLLKVVAFLLDNQADVEARDSGGLTALCHAAMSADQEMVELLLTHGADVNASARRDRQSAGPSAAEGFTPLHFAANEGSKAMTDFLLGHGAKPSPQDAFGRTPLHLAATKGYRAVAEALLAKGAEVEVRDKEGGRTPLVAAVLAGNKAIAELLLANKADMNSRSSGGLTPLMTAANDGQLDMARYLLEHGGDVNAAVNASGAYYKWTPLRFAVNNGRTDLVKLLLDAKADPNLMTDSGATPLSLAVTKASQQLVDLLLAGKADANLADRNGITPLHLAVGVRNSTIEPLLAHGANVNARDKNGRSPLHHAVLADERTAVEMLIAHGADVNLKDNDGNTPLDLRTRPSSTPGALPVQWLPPRSATGMGLNTPGQIQLGGAVNDSVPVSDGISELLRQHGAVGELERSTIRVTRKGASPPTEVFRRDSKGVNHFTLLEVIREFYARHGGYAFPDFGAITIQHGGAAPKPSNRVNLVDGTNGFDCSKDVKLEFGDIVEIPEREHSLNEQWNGVPKEMLAALDRCLAFKVRVVVKGQPTEIDYASGWYASGFLGLSNLKPILRSSSDLTRVKLKRFDPATRQPVELLVNTQDNKPSFEGVWLQGGDVIEVPDKQ